MLGLYRWNWRGISKISDPKNCIFWQGLQTDKLEWFIQLYPFDKL